MEETGCRRHHVDEEARFHFLGVAPRRATQHKQEGAPASRASVRVVASGTRTPGNLDRKGAIHAGTLT